MEKKNYIILKLILNGFKSFPFKTDISLSEDITCIVGPNGCGKSNIVDAIQWVLGEQKPTEVRLKEMAEVIFQGSKKRKSYSFAEVSLILKKNGSDEKIKITRKIHSSGESIYSINDKNIRLKDLKDFLKNENLNINSYAILSQGEIERVALLKPYEKRYLIEECAGIFRFKEKEKIALLKLEDTERNLDLTKHLLSEQEKIAHSLKVQAGRAKAFRQIEEEEKRLLEIFYAQERDKIQKDLEEIKNFIIIEEEKRLNFISNSNELEERIGILEKKEKEVEKEEEILREKKEKLLLKIQEIKFEIEKREEKIKEIDIRDKEIEEEISLIEKEIEEEKAFIFEKENIFKEKEKEIKNIYNEISEEEKVLKEIEEKLKEKEEELSKLNLPLQEIQREKNDYGTSIAIIRDSIEKTKNSISLEEKELRTFQEKKKSIEEEIKRVESDLKENSEKLSNLEKVIEVGKEELFKLENLSKEKEKEIQNLKTDLAKSEELIKREKNLLEENKNGENSLAFLIKPPLSWESFVDLLFDEISSAIVSYGELPQGNGLYIREKEIPLPEIEGAIPARDIIKLEERAPQWLVKALPPIYFVEEESQLEKISEKFPYFSFFDKNGRVIKGSLLGKPPYLKSGLLGSKLRVEILSKKIEELELEIKEKEKIFIDLEKEIFLKKKKQEENEKVKGELSFKISNLKNLEGQLKIQDLNLRERIEESKKKNINMLESLRNLEEEEKRNLNEANKYLDEEKKIKGLVENTKEIIEKIKAEEKEKQYLLQGMLKKLKEKEIERERVYQSWIKEKENFSKNEEKIKRLKKEREENKEEKGKIKKDVEKLETEFFNLKEMEEEAKEEEEIKIQEKNKIEEEIKNYQSNFKKLREIMEENFKNIQELKTKEEVLKIKFLELEEKSRNNLGIELKNCFSSNEENINEKILKIKEKKERFGQINPLAEKELEEILSKIDFIKKQKEDLENSCKALKEDLEKLGKEALKRFQETFEKVNGNFQKYFSFLFGGGQAKILLQNEENPLDAGVELIVEPPGKKIQHIMLLSGGERALVSFAFLLSLFSTSPSPFIFLDEADASLDDFNVERFINLIRKLREEIQVILITHNRRTMEEASLLLGVTMEEPGLSRVLPLSPKEILK